MVLDQVTRGEWPEERLKAAMDRFLEREQDRALFGLVAPAGQLGRINAASRMTFPAPSCMFSKRVRLLFFFGRYSGR